MSDLSPHPADTLSNREQDILRHIVEGKSNQEIANDLYLALKTVKWYNTQIYEKLGVSNRKEAAARAGTVLKPDHRMAVSGLSNIPMDPTPFVGRVEALEKLSTLIREGDTPIITITAPGGMGKTRLAIEAARRHHVHFQHGTYFVPLAPLQPSADISLTILECLAYSFQPGEGTSDQQLLDYLRHRSMLLVLDNFEHLLPKTDIVDQIARNASNIKIIITSRERLNLRCETVFSLGGFDHQQELSSDDLDLNMFLSSEAVRLFLQSARRVDADFQLTDDDIDVLFNICELTGGVPLAIELAAGWVDMLSLQEISQAIEDSLDILETSLRDVPARHASIRATIEYSLRRLEEEERISYIRLSIFPGGFDTKSALAIANIGLRQLRRFVDKSLVSAPPNHLHFMHPLLRRYALIHLDRTEQGESTKHAFIEFYKSILLDILNQAEESRAAEYFDTYQYLVSHYDNLLQFWSFIVESVDFDTIDGVMRPFAALFRRLGRPQEGYSVFKYAANALATRAVDNVSRRIAAELRAQAAIMLTGFELERTNLLMEDAVQELERFEPTHTLCALYGLLGYTHLNLKSLEEAEYWNNKGVEIAEQSGLLNYFPEFYENLGYIADQRGQYDIASSYAMKALELGRRYYQLLGIQGDYRGFQFLPATICYHLGDYEGARQHLADALSIAVEIKDLWWLGIGCGLEWDIAIQRNSLHEAYPKIVLFIQLHLESGQDWQMLGALYGLADRWFSQIEEFNRAIELLVYVAQHPLSAPYIRTRSHDRLIALKPHVDETRFQMVSAQLIGKALDEIMVDLIQEFSN